MKAYSPVQMQGQDQQQWQELATADPYYRIWHDQRQVEDESAFERWLDTPEGELWLDKERALEDVKFFNWLDTPDGMLWLDSEAESHIDQGQSYWNFDGFNPPRNYA